MVRQCNIKWHRGENTDTDIHRTAKQHKIKTISLHSTYAGKLPENLKVTKTSDHEY